MAFLLGSFASTRSSSISAYPFRSLPVRRNAESIESISLTCKKRLLGSSQRSSKGGENEDLKRTPKKISVPGSLLERFRSKKALSVTDIIDTEWCEKQMEFRLFGKPRSSQAMRAGRTRHEKLADEVVRKIKVGRLSFEDVWAEKFINFIIGTNQLCVDGLTRELPLLGFVKGVWMVGVVDEIQMPMEETTQTPSLIEIKTRSKSRLPTQAQKRKGRFQLMCYKYLWDNLVTGNLPVDHFFNYFDLSPSYILPKEIQEGASKLGFVVKNLEDLVMYFINTCCTLPPAHDHLLLRYEFQGDNSLLCEDYFSYDSNWYSNQIDKSLEFWLGEREAIFVPQNERWKCRYCRFSFKCPSCTTTINKGSVR